MCSHVRLTKDVTLIIKFRKNGGRPTGKTTYRRQPKQRVLLITINQLDL